VEDALRKQTLLEDPAPAVERGCIDTVAKISEIVQAGVYTVG
jgi:hypothetical protein